MTRPHPRSLVVVLVAVAVGGCAPRVRPTVPEPVTQQRMGEFWEDVDPSQRGDLIHGVGGRRHAPDPDVVYEATSKDTTGFSDGYDVVDPDGIEWSVKIGDEAQSEVVASRLVWAMGYRQPPVYYLPEWKVRYEGRTLTEGPARFRPKSGLENTGTWSWYENPFAGTQAYRGLLVLMMVINSTDLKEDNNAIYEWQLEGRTPQRWFVVKDLGASFGTTGIVNPKRNDIDEFEEHGFIDEVEDGRVRFEYKGRHQALLKQITPADVRWTCERLARITDAQWRDIFRAGGHTPEITERYVAKLRGKIAEGRALADAPAARARAPRAETLR